MEVNSFKSNMFNFRPSRVPKTNYVLPCNINVIEIASQFEYLSVVLDDIFEYSITANV